jgi:hypothetical protein
MILCPRVPAVDWYHREKHAGVEVSPEDIRVASAYWHDHGKRAIRRITGKCEQELRVGEDEGEAPVANMLVRASGSTIRAGCPWSCRAYQQPGSTLECHRNVSDPQIKADGFTLKQQADMAAQIYKGFGRWSSICSAIVCWASIVPL